MINRDATKTPSWQLGSPYRSAQKQLRDVLRKIPSRYRIEARSRVAAGDIKADAADTDLSLVSNHPTDRLRVAKVAIGGEHAGNDIAQAHAVTHLLDRGRLMHAEDFQRGGARIPGSHGRAQ